MYELLEEVVPGMKEWDKASWKERGRALMTVIDQMFTKLKPRTPDPEQAKDAFLDLTADGNRLDAQELASRVTDFIMDDWGIDVTIFFRKLALALQM